MGVLHLVRPTIGGHDHTTVPTSARRISNRIAVTNMRWSVIITNLIAGGMSVRGIAKRCGMEPQTLSRLHTELQNDPRWTQALALLNLHQMVCPDQHRLTELVA